MTMTKPILAVLLAIGITTTMDATGYAMFSALPLLPLTLVFWMWERLSRQEIGLIWGKPIGYYQSETGPLNQIVHLWAHEDHAHRAARREALLADHDWRQYMSKAFPLFQKLDNMVVRPAPFWSK